MVFVTPKPRPRQCTWSTYLVYILTLFSTKRPLDHGNPTGVAPSARPTSSCTAVSVEIPFHGILEWGGLGLYGEGASFLRLDFSF